MLLVALVLFFTLYPVVEDTVIARLLLNLFFMISVLSGVFAIATTQRPLLISSTLALLVIVFRWIHYFYSHETAAILEHVANVLFWFYVAISILKFILRQQIINNELLYAALAVYLIFGLAWASIYQLLELGQSGSFSLPDSPASTQTYIFSDVVLQHGHLDHPGLWGYRPGIDGGQGVCGSGGDPGPIIPCHPDFRPDR